MVRKVLKWTAITIAVTVLVIIVKSSIHPKIEREVFTYISGELNKEFNSISFEGKTPEEIISLSTAIVIARFEESESGFVKAVISEIPKKSISVNLKYSIGDVFPDASFYKESGRDRGDGVVIFYVGTPAQVKMIANYRYGEISALNHISIEELRAKIK